MEAIEKIYEDNLPAALRAVGLDEYASQVLSLVGDEARSDAELDAYLVEIEDGLMTATSVTLREGDLGSTLAVEAALCGVFHLRRYVWAQARRESLAGAHAERARLLLQTAASMPLTPANASALRVAAREATAAIDLLPFMVDDGAHFHLVAAPTPEEAAGLAHAWLTTRDRQRIEPESLRVAEVSAAALQRHRRHFAQAIRMMRQLAAAGERGVVGTMLEYPSDLVESWMEVQR